MHVRVLALDKPLQTPHIFVISTIFVTVVSLKERVLKGWRKDFTG